MSGLKIDPKTIQQAIDQATKIQAKLAWIEGLAPGWAQYPETPALTPEMFEDAIAHIEEHGWCQGADVNHDGRVCLRGAFAKGYVVALIPQLGLDGTTLISEWGDPHALETVVRRAREVLELMGVNPLDYPYLQVWNDAPGRTKDQVIDGLTLAAKTLRERGA